MRMTNDPQRGRSPEKETKELSDAQEQEDRLASLPKETQALLDKFPDKAKRQIIAQFASYSGPIAHPTLVKEYEAILPGAAERILAMAETEGNHRRQQEAKVIDCEVKCKTTGLWLGFLIGLVAVAGSCAVAIFSSPAAGAALGIGSIASLVGVFVYGSRKQD
jgi:uncharacterized membrane protein